MTSSFYLPGTLPLWGFLLLLFVSIWGYLKKDVGFARVALHSSAFLLFLSIGVLVVKLLTSDFSIAYVYNYTSSDLQRIFKFAALWAGQEGSFLVWLFWSVIIALFLSEKIGTLESKVMPVYLAVVGLLAIITVKSTPFELLVVNPGEGKGLNPLLQNYWMAIHPPVMFLGYSLTTVPFSLALTRLLVSENFNFSRLVLPWTILSLVILGAAIMLGGFWAYETLGWGGYWAWDPVENASLVPWLLIVALVHTLRLESTSKGYSRINLILSLLPYIAVVYGTFLTRSGVLADFSVHSFVDLGFSSWIATWNVLLVIVVAIAYWIGIKKIPKKKTYYPFLSTHTLAFIGACTFLVLALVVAVATSMPLLSRIWGKPSGVDSNFYNTVLFPVAIWITVLIGLVPIVKAKKEKRLKLILLFAGIALVLTIFTKMILGYRGLGSFIYTFSAMFTIVSYFAWFKRIKNIGYLTSVGTIHTGVAVFLLGALFSFVYSNSQDIKLEYGKTAQFNGYTFRLVSIPIGGKKREFVVEIVDRKGEKFFSRPSMEFNPLTEQFIGHPGITFNPLQDIYLAPQSFDPKNDGKQHGVKLRKGEQADLGMYRLKFVGFDFTIDGDPKNKLEKGEEVTLGIQVEISTLDNSFRETLKYRFNPRDGKVYVLPSFLPYGGEIKVDKIFPSEGAVLISGRNVPGTAGTPTFIVNVSFKPYIILVWIGSIMIIVGGIIGYSVRRYSPKAAREKTLEEKHFVVSPEKYLG